MDVKFFNQYFMTPEIDIDYYEDFKFEFLFLYLEWDNSLCIFTNGFERFGGMVGGLQ